MRVVPLVVNRAKAIKLLYDAQLNPYRIKLSAKQKAFAFHDFVDHADIGRPNELEENYLLLMGWPWYIKGVDIAIQAFDRVRDVDRGVWLRIVGHISKEEAEYLMAWSTDRGRVKIEEPVDHRTAMGLMARCRAYVLASRTEAMGRVLFEAMAYGRPIVAARVDGTPQYIEHGRNGLLFEKEDVGDLAENLRIILTDRDLANKLAKEGNSMVQHELSNSAHRAKYAEMLRWAARM